MILNFRFSDGARGELPATHFGLLHASGIDLGTLADELKPIRKVVQRSLSVTNADLTANLDAIENYFTSHNHRSPLRHQREHFQKSGIPSSNPIVTLLLLGELQHGTLIGIQDAGAIARPLEFDVLANPEGFEGMRGSIQCNPGEIVLRDASGIIASMLQGPDKRTQIHAGTREIAAFVFAVPGQAITPVTDTLASLEAMLTSAADSVSAAVYSTGTA